MTREELNEKKQQAIFKEQNKEQIKKIVKKITKVLLIILILGTIFFSYTTYISSVKIKVREYRITNKKIPESFNGTKIIQISDLHYGTTMFESNLKDIVKKVNERKPDIIVFTGDLIDKDYKLSSKEQEKVIKELQKLNASLGKYAIFGDEDNEQFKIILNQCNFNNNPILLIGLSSDKKKQNIDKAYAYFKQEVYNSNIYTIALLHEPDTVDDIVERYNTDLFLAGHSNNGNIRIPFINYSLFKVDGAKKYNQDYYKVKDSKLFISSGFEV